MNVREMVLSVGFEEHDMARTISDAATRLSGRAAGLSGLTGVSGCITEYSWVAMLEESGA